MNNRKKTKVAVFDIDGTVFRSSLLIELTEALIEEGVFSAAVRKKYTRAYKNWLDRKGDYRQYIDGVVKAFETNLKGVTHQDFLRVARKVMAFHQNRVYRYTRDLIKELKRRGYYLLAISGSPTEIVAAFAKKLGFQKVYGRTYELNNRNRFTGKTLYAELIRDKAKILKRAIQREGLTLKNSIGVGDTEADIPFLELVERPIAFNPSAALARHAKKKRWMIVVERKDVIYELNNFSIISLKENK